MIILHFDCLDYLLTRSEWQAHIGNRVEKDFHLTR